MPIYEYECGKCGTFEATQKITDRALTRCPTCKGKVKKLISNTSFQLKGTGWYVTDYARKDKSSTTTEKTANGGKSAAKAETKSDGNAAEKKDATEKAAAKPAATEPSTS